MIRRAVESWDKRAEVSSSPVLTGRVPPSPLLPSSFVDGDDAGERFGGVREPEDFVDRVGVVHVGIMLAVVKTSLILSLGRGDDGDGDSNVDLDNMPEFLS